MKDIKICTELIAWPNAQMDMPIEELVQEKSFKWTNGTTIRVKFLNGTPFLKSKVEHFAHLWEGFVNIKFDFLKDSNDENCQIRIAFNQGQGSWSYIGTSCLNVDKNKPTMNYGWFDENTRDEEFSRTVLHEFGHSLGFGHEHLHPEVSIPWDREKVYQYYMGPPNNWDKETIDRNIFQKYSRDLTNFSEFDKNSIMLYAIPNELTIGDYEVGWNRELSATDKKFASILYPKQLNATTLRAHNGQYVCAESGGGREIVSNRDKVGPWEQFELIKLDGNKVALRAHNGQYVCAENGGGREVVANRDKQDVWETFTMETTSLEHTAAEERILQPTT
jgi:serralysin